MLEHTSSSCSSPALALSSNNTELNLNYTILDKEMHCVCGYSRSEGNSLARHLLFCEHKSAYPSTKSAQENTVQRNMLNALGLMRSRGDGEDEEMKNTTDDNIGNGGEQQSTENIIEGSTGAEEEEEEGEATAVIETEKETETEVTATTATVTEDHNDDDDDNDNDACNDDNENRDDNIEMIQNNDEEDDENDKSQEQQGEEENDEDGDDYYGDDDRQQDDINMEEQLQQHQQQEQEQQQQHQEQEQEQHEEYANESREMEYQQ